jgi:hypothetical protein
VTGDGVGREETGEAGFEKPGFGRIASPVTGDGRGRNAQMFWTKF